METPTDCLVLMIKELHRSEDSDTDIVLFILYDTLMNNYVIRGKRSDVKSASFEPFSFTCKKSKDAYNFIDFIFYFKHKVSIELYNYDNLPYDSNDITFEFLNDYVDRKYEVCAYEDATLHRHAFYFNKKRMLRLLKTLKNVSNEY